ncbi:MAG: hypothetical protein AB7O39_10450 [Flavobacteriaceae bacterium]
MIRLLKSHIAPHMQPGTEAMAYRIAAILRDTDWSGAREIAAAESARLRLVLTSLSERGLLDESVPDLPARDDYQTLAADVVALRGIVGRLAARLAGQREPALDTIRLELAEALIDCAAYGLSQTSAPASQRQRSAETRGRRPEKK